MNLVLSEMVSRKDELKDIEGCVFAFHSKVDGMERVLLHSETCFRFVYPRYE